MLTPEERRFIFIFTFGSGLASVTSSSSDRPSRWTVTVDLLAALGLGHRFAQVVPVRDRLGAELEDHVAGLHPGLGRRDRPRPPS